MPGPGRPTREEQASKLLRQALEAKEREDAAKRQQQEAEREERELRMADQRGGNRPSSRVLGFTTRAQVRPEVPGLEESLRVLGGVVAGAGISTLFIANMPADLEVLVALGLAAGSAVLTAASPVGSLPEEVGMGGTIGSLVYLGLLATGRAVLNPAPGTATTPGGAVRTSGVRTSVVNGFTLTSGH